MLGHNTLRSSLEMKKLVVMSAVALLVGLVLFAGTNIGEANNANAKNVTFNKDVAKILYKNFVVCHRADDMAPMSLMSYKEARPWARSIKEKVVSKEMPPWHADPNHGEFANDRRL